ncbi:ROK family protein [Agrobacterium sp. NPDC090273]|uniref:ROK family protein n=1 Tax=Agrobacterium sp. NPDC090273 TaxID=3363919 RepID=UPI00383B93E7
MIEGYAIDLGGTKTAVARVIAGRVDARLQAPTNGDATISQQIDVMAELLGKLGFQTGDKLGVAVAGRVDAAGRWQAVNARTLSQIGGENLLESLRHRFGNNVSVMNDAAAAALAEAKLGAGKGVDHFAYLTVSTGVGGGIVLNGRPVQSTNGLAGHLGFVSSPLGRDLCGSGRTGTVESTASGRAIARAAETADAKAAFEADTPLARAAIDCSAAAIARLCADLNAIFGLDRVALGGSVGLAPGYLQRVLSNLETEPELFRVAVVPAALGHDSALLGVLLTKGEKE